MFVVDLPVPKNCYECPMCQSDTGGCTLSELNQNTEFNAGMYSNVIMMASDWKNNLKKNIDKEYIASVEGITIEDVDEVLKNNGKHPNCPIFKWNTEELKDCSHNELEQYCKTLNMERQESKAACSEFNIFLDKLEDAMAIDYADWILLHNIIRDALKMRARRFPNYERRNHYDKYDLAGSPCKRCKYFRAEDEQCTSGYFPFDCGLNNNKYFEAKED